MAVRARARYSGSVDVGGTQKTGGTAMARLARSRSRDMSPGFGHYSSVLPAVTAGTARRDAGMVHCPCREGKGVDVA